jgi:hypothetical protein
MARNSLTYIAGFSILSLAAILVGSRDQRTQFWKGAIQESFQQSLVDIGSVVSEEKIRNHWTNCNQTLVEWALGGPLSKL